MKYIWVYVTAAVCAAAVWAMVARPWVPEPTYRGKSESEWIKLTSDNDLKTRELAYESLAHIPSVKSDNAVKAGMKDPAVDAFCAYAGAAKFPDEAVAVMLQKISGDTTGGMQYVRNGYVERVVSYAGKTALPLKVQLLQIKKSLRDNEFDTMLKDRIDGIVSMIDGTNAPINRVGVDDADDAMTPAERKEKRLQEAHEKTYSPPATTSPIN